MLFSSSKKSKSFDFDTIKSSQPPLFTLAPTNLPTKCVELPQVVDRKRKAEDISSTPNTKRRFEPSSAPKPAGRSPKHKRAGIMSRRRATASPFTRVDPPTLSSSATESGLPFSIDAAVAGTVPTVKSKSKSPTKGWHFEIHEDSPEDEMSNLMEHSTCTLDISDDEGRLANKADRDNKENIPPIDYQTAANIPATRRDMMTDEVRAPLGDLNTIDFYADGCNASSFIIVPTEDLEHADNIPRAASNLQDVSFPTHSLANTVAKGQQGWEDLLASDAGKNINTAADADFEFNEEFSKDDSAEIKIWESESAKGDDIDVNAQDAISERLVLA